jgi:outer membrane protein TolC
VSFTITEHLAADIEESAARLVARERYRDRDAFLHGLGGMLFFALIVGMPLPAQTNSVSTGQVNQLPFSGRANVNGSVSATQSITNTGAGNSVNIIDSTVNLTSPYNGSVPGTADINIALPLTLDNALKLGLRNNLGQISQTNSVLEARGQRLVARSALLPNVGSSVGETLSKIDLAAQGLKSSALGIPGLPNTLGPFNFFDARAVRVNQTVFDLVQAGNLHSATQNLKAAQAAAMDARDLIVFAVVGSYLQVTTAQARVVAARAQAESSRSVYQQASDRLKEGLNARIDATRSQVQYQTDVQRLRAEQADVEKQKLNLGRVIGLPYGSDFTIAETFPYTALGDLTVEEAIKRANAGRADLRSARAAVQAADSALKAAHAEYLPTLSMAGDFGAEGINPAQGHITYTVSGTLNVPIFQGGRVQGDVEQALATLNQRKAELQDTFGVIDRDVRVAFIDLNSAADQVLVAESNVSLSRDILLQARDRFVAGIADTVEVVQAQQTVAQADNDYINAVFEHNLAKVALSRAMGQAELTVQNFLRGK